jgi:hypothetical protein
LFTSSISRHVSGFPNVELGYHQFLWHIILKGMEKSQVSCRLHQPKIWYWVHSKATGYGHQGGS